MASGCCKFPVGHSFPKQSRPALPLGSLPSGPASLPRTFWPGLLSWAELVYLQPLLVASYPPSVGRLNRQATQDLRLKVLFLDFKTARTPAFLTSTQSSCGRGDVCSWLFQLKPDYPRIPRGGQVSPGDIPMFIRYSLTASVSSGISRISTSASNTSMLEKLSGSKIFCERRKFT